MTKTTARTQKTGTRSGIYNVEQGNLTKREEDL